MKPRVYLAGPDVFLPNAKEQGEALKGICAAEGLEGVFPLDADVAFGLADSPPQKAERIFQANLSLIKSCQGLLANMAPFRGSSMDIGTGWEMGFAWGLGIPVVGYTADHRRYHERVEADRQAGTPSDEYEVEDFGLIDNLMPNCSADTIFAKVEDAAKHVALSLRRTNV